MTETPKFDPQRSAAIRHLLIENVEAEPKRRTRHLRALLAGLIITGVVASGSTALALNRDALFSAPPAATETPSSTPATTSPTLMTPPTPTAVTSVSIASAPIAPHDVVSPPSGTGWSLQLPAPSGTCLTDASATNVADGLVLVTVGPIFQDDVPTPDGCDLALDGISVSLVDTRSGQILWSREWAWTRDPGKPAEGKAQAVLLSASNKILVLSRADLGGPNEVIDLGTGDTVGPFTPDEEGEAITSAYAAPDDSGDVYVVFSHHDENGGLVAPSRVTRLDPLDAAVAVWSTQIDGADVQLDAPRNRMPYAMIEYTPAGSIGFAYGLLDISTGELSRRDSFVTYKYFTEYSIRPSSYSAPLGTPVTLAGLNAAGEQIWERTEPPGSSTSEVLTVNAKPGGRASTQVGNGQFLVANSQGVTLVDGASGSTIWSSSPSSCGLSDGAYQTYDVTESSDGSSITVGSPAGSCRLDSATGTQLTSTAAPWNQFRAVGESLVYGVADGTGTAFDAASGAAVWSVPTDSFIWMYAGGYLVALDGSTLRSVG